MSVNNSAIDIYRYIIILLILINGILLRVGFTIHESWYWLLLLTGPALVLALLAMIKSKHHLFDRAHGELKMMRRRIADKRFRMFEEF